MGTFADFWGKDIESRGFVQVPNLLRCNLKQFGLCGAYGFGLYQALETYIAWTNGPDFVAQISDRLAAREQGVSRRTAFNRRKQLQELGWITCEGGQRTGKPIKVSLIPLVMILEDFLNGVPIPEGNRFRGGVQ